MEKEEKKNHQSPPQGFSEKLCQDLRVPFYETFPVGYLRCVVL